MENGKEQAKKVPLLLLFSTRERVRSILTIGLSQCNYRIIQADNPHIAGVKASQFLPDIIIADFTTTHPKDILLLARLSKALRTRDIPVIVIIPDSIRKVIDALHSDEEVANDDVGAQIHALHYPFNFAALLELIKRVLATSTRFAGAAVQRKQAGRVIVKRLYDPLVETRDKLKEIESVLDRQWAFPYAVVKAMDIIESDSSCCDELAKCISTGPTISSAILKVANTVQYAKRGGRITDIKDAVVRLGFRETRNLLGCLSLINMSPEIYKTYGFSRRDFWLHSLAVGLIAEKLCEDAGYRRPELAFLSGLLHDLGKIPMDNNFPAVYSRLLEETAGNVTAFHETEKDLLGFTHATLAHYLTSQWNFPSSITLAILRHHDHVQIAAVKTPFDRMLQEAVYMADIFAKAITLGHSCDQALGEVPASFLNDFRIPHGPSDRFFAAVLRNLNQLCTFLNLSAREIMQENKPAGAEETTILVVYGKNIRFHPFVLALRHNGYEVKTANQYNPVYHRTIPVIIYIPERGQPLDIMLGEEVNENREGTVSTLRYFLLDLEGDEGNVSPHSTGGDVFLLNRRHLDMRYLLHSLDSFIQNLKNPLRLDSGTTAPNRPEG